MKIETALLSVSDKQGIEELGRSLAELGIQVVSTGGTARTLERAGVPVTPVSEYTGFPEILEGRVKTLHPRIHGGILARHDDPAHQEALRQQDIRPLGLVVVNLYPFARTVRKQGVGLEEAVEQIDIGGPAMVRAAAKNFSSVTVVVDPADYGQLVKEIKVNNGQTSRETRHWLARKAFHHTAGYDSAIAAYLDARSDSEETLPAAMELTLERVSILRYGENPHQRAGVYRSRYTPSRGLVAARQHHGKQLSFNNFSDLEAAWRLCAEFREPFCVIIKHNNPCGAARAASPLHAYQNALACDPLSAFGSIVGFNRQVDGETAEAMRSLFVEAVIAPGYREEAIEIFKRKKNLRVIEMESSSDAGESLELRSISGGFLIQDTDLHRLSEKELKSVAERTPTEEELKDLRFAWAVCKHVKSNAIVFARRERTIGIGAGQMSRVDSVRLASQKAQVETENCVMASDAFFPFPDGVEEAASAGVRAVIQPGGSIRDQDVIDCANRHRMAMVFTGVRHFKH